MSETKQDTEKKHKGISRIDQDSKHTHGWYVRVRFQGQTKSKFFSDKKLSGREKGLKSAIAWRNNTEKILGKARTNKHICTVPNAITGVVGVTLNEKYNRYESSWIKPNGKQIRNSFSVSKYGKEDAFLRACTLRHEKEQIRLTSDSSCN